MEAIDARHTVLPGSTSGLDGLSEVFPEVAEGIGNVECSHHFVLNKILKN